MDEFAADVTTTGVLRPGETVTGGFQVDPDAPPGDFFYDSDWVRLDLPASQTFLVEVTYSGDYDPDGGSNNDIELWAWAESELEGYPIFGDTVPGNPLARVYTLWDQEGEEFPVEFFLELVGYDGAEGETYSITATLVPDDHGNVPDTATPAALDVLQTGIIDHYDDIDVFVYDLQAGIYTGSIDGGNGMDLLVFGPDGVVLDDYNPDRRAFSVETAGRYFAQVGPEVDIDEPYEMLIATFSGDPEGGTPDTAMPLAFGDARWGLIDYSSDRDLFAVELTEGRSYTFHMRGNSGVPGAESIASPALTLLDAAEETVAEGARERAFGSWISDFVAPTTGTYYLDAGLNYFYSAAGYQIRALEEDTGDETGTTATDTRVGGYGDDSLGGLDGDDKLFGGGGNDTLDGGTGDDRIWGRAGDDSILGGAGDDHIAAGTGDDVIEGGAGDDLIGGGQGDETILGGDGDDTIYAGQGDAVIDAGAGNDVIHSGGVATINGGAGDDLIRAGVQTDVVFTALTDGEVDTIRSFDAPRGEAQATDRIVFDGIDGLGFDDLDITQSDSDVHIEAHGHLIVLLRENADNYDEDVFLFV